MEFFLTTYKQNLMSTDNPGDLTDT